MATPKTLGLGRYRVRSVLGRSEYATVYDCYDIDADEAVAIKVLALSGHDPEIIRAMYRREVGALEGVQHPYVVRMRRYFAEEEEGRLNIVLDRIPGGLTLDRLISSDDAPACTQRIRWRMEQLLGLLDGLDHAHGRHIVHRDVKLKNVLFDRDTNELRLVDFGIARLLENYARGAGGATLRAFYTLPFAAPEQVLGKETSFAADLHAFGLVTASMLAWRIPGADFDRDRLRDFLGPFTEAIQDAEIADLVLNLVRDLLHADPRKRPTVPRIELVLRRAFDATVERQPVPVALTHAARRKAGEHGLDTTRALLDDLNDGLRVVYQTDQDESYVIRCYGKTTQAVLKPDREDVEALVMVDLVVQHPTVHARRREHAAPGPVLLEEGRGSAQALLDFAWQDFEQRRREAEDRAARQDMLNVARFMLNSQRERLEHLEIRYELPGEDDDERGTESELEPWKQALAALASTPEPATPSRKKKTRHASGEYLKLHVVSVRSGYELDADGDEEREEALSEDWIDGLTNESTFLLDGRSFADAHGYDHRTQTLTLKLKRAVTLPAQGTISCRNVAQEAALERQEKALTAFLDEDAVNPRLASRLLNPARNTLDERPDVALIQPLVPDHFIIDLVARALSCQDFFFIQGPPGTGKTTVITEVMAQILRHDPAARVLLTSQANEAVNNAVDELRRLADTLGEPWRIVRDASPRAEKRDDSVGFTRAFSDWAARTAARCEQEADALPASVEDGTKRESAVTALENWRAKLPFVKDAKQDYAESIQVHGVTCLRVPTLWRVLREVRFDWVIIDEAARATPAELMVALVTGRRFILVGDHRQLPPFLSTQTRDDLRDADFDLDAANQSMFEVLFDRVTRENRETLRRQFRMHRSIAELVGTLYYADIGLETGVADDERQLALARFGGDNRVFWLDVAHGRERQTQGDTSKWNHEEVTAIERLLLDIEREAAANGVEYTVGVIAAYARQAVKLNERLAPKSRRWEALRLRIATVDAFQGKQDDIIVYSMVRANTSGLQFISDRRRLNVAFSRARRLLVICGHRATALRSPEVRRVVDAIPKSNVIPAGGGR